MMQIKNRDYGFIAYLILKYDAKRINDGVMIDTDKTDIELLKEYTSSDFNVYNEILKKIVRG